MLEASLGYQRLSQREREKTFKQKQDNNDFSGTMKIKDYITNKL